MFLTWTGFEIDGSDTNFDLVLPENELTLDLVIYLISLPVFDLSEIKFYDQKNKELSWELFREKLLTRSFERLSIQGRFKAFDILDEKTQQDFKQISQNRQPLEANLGKVQNPASIPTRFAGMMEFHIMNKAKNMVDKYSSYDQLEGYEKNVSLFLEDFSQATAFELYVPVGSIYEYFIYLMDCLTERFPSLATSGGLDCGGGWTKGCTYSDSLYGYEKITVPLQYGIKHFLKKIVSHGITSFTGQFFNTSRKRIFDFVLLNSEEEEGLLKFGDYVEYAENQLYQAEHDYDAICRTAIKIWIPSPDEFKSDTALYSSMVPLASLMTKYNDIAFLAFYKKGETYFAEFRIAPAIKDYVLKYLDLIRLDAFSDIKEKMYIQRQTFEKNRPLGYQVIRKKKRGKKQ